MERGWVAIEYDGLFEEGCEEMDANKRREPQDFH